MLKSIRGVSLSRPLSRPALLHSKSYFHDYPSSNGFGNSATSSGINVDMNGNVGTNTNTNVLHIDQQLLDQVYEHNARRKYTDRATYAATLQPMQDAWSLFPEVYTDRSFAQTEREKVFKQAWTAVGHRSDTLLQHGDVVSTIVCDIPILITIDADGQLRAFHNICRHRGSILLKEGKYKKCTVIRCPYHSWGYKCNGTLAGAPYFNDNKMPVNKKQRVDPSLKNELTAFDKINFNKQDYSLFEIGIKEVMGTMFINFDHDIARREELFHYQFGDLEDNYGYYPWHNMRIAAQYDYHIDANWKLIAENFMEYYHLPWIHPALCEVSSVANHSRRQGSGQYTAFCTYPLTYGGTAADPDAFPHFEGINDVDKEASWFIHTFPNVSYFLFPHHCVSLITFPTNEPGVTREKMTILMDKDIVEQADKDSELQAKIQQLTDFYCKVNDEDIFAVENVQKGIQSTDVYRGGRLSAKFEEPIYRMQHILIDYMTDEQHKVYPGDADFVPSAYWLPKQTK